MSAHRADPATVATAFTQDVPPGGYAWWYLDALSDDGHHALTIIAFIGSVFSPYYAWARRKAAATPPGTSPDASPDPFPGTPAPDPANHCAFNVALYATHGSRGPTAWTMTERGSAALRRDATSLHIGPSAMRHEGGDLVWTLDERGAPWPSRVQGTVRLHPLGWHLLRHTLDTHGHHTWQPMAPVARVEVRLTAPRLSWTGQAYMDGNRGQRTLEHDFVRWDWARAPLSGRRCAVLYDVSRTDGSQGHLAIEFDARGRTRSFEAPGRMPLPASAWHVRRATRGVPLSSGMRPRIVQTLEDGPFYARSLLRLPLLGEDPLAMHESLDMRRWRMPVVQAMLPFRMPRRG